MKAIEKPTQKAIAVALGVGPAMVTRYAKKGMPLHSIEAAKTWRSENVRVRYTPEADMGSADRALQGERAAERAAALLMAAGELLGTGGHVHPLLSTIREAMAAVPPAQRDRVLLPVEIMDLLTHDVAQVMEQGDPGGRLHGTLYLGQHRRGDAVDMGAFWYAVAAGEIGVRAQTR